jgi:hypothetical protein
LFLFLAVTYPTKTIYIRHFPTHFVKQDLLSYFLEFGSIDKIELVKFKKKSFSLFSYLNYVCLDKRS